MREEKRKYNKTPWSSQSTTMRLKEHMMKGPPQKLNRMKAIKEP
jgi:hypothetical protein